MTTRTGGRATPAAGAQREIIWSDDFSNPSNWVAGNVAGASDDTWVIGTDGPSGAFAIDPILSSTASNGFGMFDSDLLCSGNQEATLTMANSVDLSGHSAVLLQFEQFYKRYYDNVWVDWSTNGDEWNAIQVNANLDHGGSAAPTANPELTVVNVSDLAGSATAYIRFRFESTPNSVDPLTGAGYSTNLVGCAYAWMVDDVAFTTLPDHEIRMNYAYTSTTGTGEEYGRIPAAQLPGTMNVGAELFNLGANEQTNVVVNVAFADADGNAVPGFSGTIDVGSIASLDTTVADGNINIPAGLGNGVYTATFTINSDNIALDQDPDNNEKLRNFEVTSDTYSVDAIGNHPDGTEDLQQFGSSSFTDNAEMYLMSMYTLNVPMTVTGLVVELSPNAVAGDVAELQAMILDTAAVIQLPASVSNPVDGNISASITLTEAHVAAGAIGIPFSPAATLSPGTYFAAVRVAGSGTTTAGDPEVLVLDDVTVPQPAWTSAVFLPVDFNDDGTEGRHSYTNGNAFAVRLSSLPTVGIVEPAELAGISLFPNPTTGVFRITSDRTDVLFVEVTDALGKIVRTTSFSTATTMDLSDLAAGVYNVTVASKTERSIQRLTLK